MICRRRPFPHGWAHFGLACISALTGAACLPSALGSEPPAVTIVLDPADPGPVISPLLFGANLEHTRRGMWQGLSAELLANRKLAGTNVLYDDNHMPFSLGKVGADGVVAHWYGIGPPAAAFAPDEKVAYDGKNSQRIEVSAQGARGGLGQAGLAIHGRTEYAFRFQLKAEPSLRVTARLCDASGRTEYLRRSEQVDAGDWRTWSFAEKTPQTDPQAKLEISFQGPGTLWLGAASLVPADHFHGLRRNVVARLREVTVPILRWPGGNFTRYYRWKEGLLPLDRRPPISAGSLPHSDGYDFHELGIDEYLALCGELGSHPMITVTMGIPDGPQEAADWVEYCNGSAETRWGRIRAERGHPQPYNVKHWAVGNEIWGPWMGPAHTSATQYARDLKQYAAAMRKVYPGLVLLASGTDAVTLGNEWDKTVVAQAADAFDWLSVHHYAPITRALAGPEGEREFTRQACRPQDGVLPWLAEMRRAIEQSKPAGKRIPMAFDEWNLWHEWFSKVFEREWHIGPIDAAFATGQLHMMCRETQPLDMPMAGFFQPVNEGLILVKPFSAELTAMGQAFALLRPHQGGRLLKTEPPAGPTALDTLASLSGNGGVICVTLLNRATAADRTVELRLTRGKPARASATILSVPQLTPDAVMDSRTEQLAVAADGRMRLLLPRFGIARVEIATEAK